MYFLLLGVSHRFQGFHGAYQCFFLWFISINYQGKKKSSGLNNMQQLRSQSITLLVAKYHTLRVRNRQNIGFESVAKYHTLAGVMHTVLLGATWYARACDRGLKGVSFSR
jgi:hypothetical protein